MTSHIMFSAGGRTLFRGTFFPPFAGQFQPILSSASLGKTGSTSSAAWPVLSDLFSVITCWSYGGGGGMRPYKQEKNPLLTTKAKKAKATEVMAMSTKFSQTREEDARTTPVISDKDDAPEYTARNSSVDTYLANDSGESSDCGLKQRKFAVSSCSQSSSSCSVDVL